MRTVTRFTFHCQDLNNLLGPYLYHFIPFTTYLYLPHTNICGFICKDTHFPLA